MTARAERNRFVFEVSIYDMRARTGRLGAASGPSGAAAEPASARPGPDRRMGPGGNPGAHSLHHTQEEGLHSIRRHQPR